MRLTIILVIIIVLSSFSPFLATPVKAAVIDTDDDGLADSLEIQLGTDPQNMDSDSDGYKDGAEVFAGYNPLVGNKDRSLSKRVEIDLAKQQLFLYFNNIKIGSMPVSTGVPRMATPQGTFKILRKVLVVRYIGPGYDLPNTKWNLEFKHHYFLHGAYWHNQFGKRPMSHGCVNIAYKNAEKLYKFLDAGDEVKIFGKTPSRVAYVK